MTHLDSFIESSRREVNTFLDGILEEELLKAAQLIWDAQEKGGRIHVTGIGKPAHVAGYVASLMSSTGTPTYFLHGTGRCTAPAASWSRAT